MGSIPEHEYIKYHGTKVITHKLIKHYHTPNEIKTLYKWLAGQTVPVLDDGTCAVYVDDYERWLSEGRLDRQLPHNWD